VKIAAHLASRRRRLAGERRRIDMHDDLVAVARRALARPTREQRVREYDQRVRVLLSARNPYRRFRGNVLRLRRGLAGSLESAREQRPVFGRQPAAQGPRPVLVLVQGEVAALDDPLGFLARHAAVRRDHPLKLRGGCVLRQVEEFVLASESVDTCDRADLREAQLALPEDLAHSRERLERSCHAHVLARGARRDRATPAQPLRGGRHPQVHPDLPAVELGDHSQPVAHRGVDVGGEALDLVRELVVRQLTHEHMFAVGSDGMIQAARAMRCDGQRARRSRTVQPKSCSSSSGSPVSSVAS
jgi:hypothetical protein